MAKKKYVLLSFVTRAKLEKEPYGQEILSLFYDQYPKLTPEYANFYEPINNPVNNVHEALKFWEWDQVAILYRRRHSVQGWWFLGDDRESVGSMIFEYNWNTQIPWFQLFQELIPLSEAYFGYVHVFTDKEIEPAGAGSAIDCFLNGTPGIHLKRGIPNLGWGNYFGEEYVKEIDVDLLRKHGFSVEKRGEGYVFHITDKLSDVIDNYEHFDERRQLLKSLFRPDLFQKYERYAP